MLPVLLCALAACAAPPPDEIDVAQRRGDVDATIASLSRRHPEAGQLFATSYGYVVFPEVWIGGAGIGGGHGEGVVFERGVAVGTAAVTKFTIGAQIGGQRMSEVIFFETEPAMRRFQSSGLEFDASATAVALGEGVTATAGYENGVRVFAITDRGMMAAATIGGQSFDYRPLAGSPR
jgi:lipid-binding SYLF domain-containing protein